MSTTHNRGHRIFSSVSDETLAAMLEQDFKQMPGEFGSEISSTLTNSSHFLRNTSGRGIDVMKKWL